MGIVQLYKQFMSNENIRHLLMNYSSSSAGVRHPDGPVGWVARDEGQLDLYAGKSKLVLGIGGEFLSISTAAHHISERTQFTTRGISNFRILGKSFSQKIFSGQKILAIKPEANLLTLGLIGPGTYVQNPDGSISQIIGAVPCHQVFDETLLFEDLDNSGLLPASVELAKTIFKAIGAVL